VFGGGNRDRTCDLLNANQMLSQLSYAPKRCGRLLLEEVRWVNRKSMIAETSDSEGRKALK
jgi:hypothetical protein